MPLDEEGREPRGIDAKPKGIMGFVETHGPLVLGVFAALAAGWYLLTSGKGGGATTISQPQPSGGGGQGGGGAPSNPTVSGYLPYSPDTSILQHLSDTVLEGLYNQLFNAEAGANLAYSQGNTSLFNQLQATISNLQDQIAAYVPAKGGGGGGGGGGAAINAVNNNASTWQQTLNEITTRFAGTSNNFTNIDVGSPFATGWITTVAQVFQVPNEVAQNLYSAIVQNPSYFRPAGVTGGSQWDYDKIVNTLQGQLDLYNSQHGLSKSAAAQTTQTAQSMVSQTQALGLPRTKRIPNV